MPKEMHVRIYAKTVTLKDQYANAHSYKKDLSLNLMVKQHETQSRRSLKDKTPARLKHQILNTKIYAQRQVQQGD